MDVLKRGSLENAARMANLIRAMAAIYLAIGLFDRLLYLGDVCDGFRPCLGMVVGIVWVVANATALVGIAFLIDLLGDRRSDSR
jgi:hypothetical protein